MLADREFDELVVKELEMMLERVKAEGTSGKLERYHRRYSHFLFQTHTVDIGEGDTFRRLWAVSHLMFSDDRAAIVQASDEIAEVIEDEL